MRTPVYQKEILAIFDKHHLLTIADLEKLVPKADYSTLFRNIKTLVKSGVLKQVAVDKNKIFYEHADHQHDHLVCKDCGKVEAVHLPRPKGAKFVISEIVAHGECADCKTDRKS